MSESVRQDWAVPVAEHLGQAIRLLNQRQREVKARHGGAGDLEAEILLEDLPAVFSRAVYAIGTVPGGRVQREIERMITVDGLTADAALRKAGC